MVKTEGIVKKILKKLKKGEEPKEKQEVMSDSDIEKLPEKIVKERAEMKGQLTALKQKIESVQEGLAPDVERKEIAKFLKKQKQQLAWREFKGAISLKELFNYISKGGNIGLLSYNQKKSFGILNDIAIRPDGRFAILAKNPKGKGSPKPVVVGINVQDLFWDYEGLSNSASMNFFLLSVNERGDYVHNILQREVPRIMIDVNGRYHITEHSQEKYIAQLIEKEAQINELTSLLEAAHEALSRHGFDLNLTKLMAKLNRERRQTAETILASDYKKTTEIMKSFRELGGELAIRSQTEWINKAKINNLEELKKEIMDKLMVVESSTPVDTAQERMEMIADFIINLITGKKVSFAKDEKQIEEEKKTHLTKKFEEVKL